MLGQTRSKGLDSVLLFLIVIQSVLYITIFPNLEYPDAAAHIKKLYVENSDPYFIILENLTYYIENSLGIYEVISVTRNPDFSFFSWNSLNLYQDGNYLTIMILQSVNVFFIVLSFLLFKFVVLKLTNLTDVEKNMMLRATLLYYMYPAVSYLIVGITPDFFIYLYQPFFILLIFMRKHFINALAIFCLYFFQDDGAIINLLFLIIYLFNYGFKQIRKYVPNTILVITYISFLSVLYFTSRRFVGSLLNSNNEFINIMQNSIDNYGNVTTKIVNFITSSFYLLGSGSYVTFPLLYIAFVYFIYKIVKKSLSSEEFLILDNLIITSILTITIMIVLYPPYSHVRFYMFFIFIIILGLFKYILNDEFFLKEKTYMLWFSFFFFHNTLLILLIRLLS